MRDLHLSRSVLALAAHLPMGHGESYHSVWLERLVSIGRLLRRVEGRCRVDRYSHLATVKVDSPSKRYSIAAKGRVGTRYRVIRYKDGPTGFRRQVNSTNSPMDASGRLGSGWSSCGNQPVHLYVVEERLASRRERGSRCCGIAA